MRKHVFSAIIFALILIFVSMLAYCSDTILITTGSKGGGYYNIGVNLCKQLSGRGFSCEVKGSRGSWANLQRIDKGHKGKTYHIGLSQLDAFASYTKQNPSSENNLSIYGNLGKECAFQVVRKGSKVTDEDDFQSESIKPKNSVGKSGSGSMKTWEFMRLLEPGYKATEMIYKGGVGALAQLKSGEIDGVFFVTTPGNFNHKMISSVNNNSKTLMFIDIDDSDLNDKLNGKPIYTFEKIDTRDGGAFSSDNAVETICTQVVVVINQAYDNNLEDEGEDTIGESVADITLNFKDQLLKF
jgi:TRAP-type uncharacterized transport system substrate-binding protein